MRVLLLESDQHIYLEFLARLAPALEVTTQLEQAARCPIWLGEPELAVPLLREGLRPEWMQSTWAGITPLLEDGLRQDYRLTRAVGVFGQVMAEYVLTYLLLHRRQVLERLHSQVEGHWDARSPGSLRGLKVLLVGAGEIGQQVAAFLAPFGVELRGVVREPRPVEPFTQVLGMAQLAEQAAWADVLVNLLPNTPDTQDVYDAALLRRMRADALFINSGRGVAVVEEDLVAVLREGHLAGAVIDVCREEPLPAGHPFWSAPRLLLTGHTSAPTEPAALTELFLENLQRFERGETLRGQVEFAKGY
ncbi:D-2-hydroxyacid dehydrogenase [Pseudomonas sp. LRF_L74]|uniref:D-2-hydroxyacid dehydrogenase n=1 Tax=Pseudomonas sp. LRF_L74 TaxID=3369422 RepID=UPI003F612E0B